MKLSPAKVIQSSEFPRLPGISADTLRYYERNRLLPAAQRSSSGYRLFPPEALMRVRMIRGALSVGKNTTQAIRNNSIKQRAAAHTAYRPGHTT